MPVLHLLVDAHAGFTSPEAGRCAAPRFQAGIAAIRDRLEPDAARLLPRFARSAQSLWLQVEFDPRGMANLVPEVTKAARGQELRVRVALDGTGRWWLEDGELLRRVDVAATVALAMLARVANADDSGLATWLQAASVPCGDLDEGVPRCPYCHSRVRTERTRQCLRCGNAWHEQDSPDGSLPPARTDRPLEPVAPPPDALAMLADHPAGSVRSPPKSLRQAAHPRARKLMPRAGLWSVTDELAPFGNDEGNAALDAFREWRAVNPDAPLLGFLDWTIDSPANWKFPLTAEQAGDAFLAAAVAGAKAGTFDFQNEVWRRDTNILAGALAQLVIEGRIDAQAKPFVQLALDRQSHPLVLEHLGNAPRRAGMIEGMRAAIDAA